MEDISGFPYFEVQFNKQGMVHDNNEVTKLSDCLGRNTITDLFVISHGWNNHMDEARGLYLKFFERMREVLNFNIVPGVNTRHFAILGVLWPSKKFADKNLISSGAAGAASPVSDTAIKEQLDDLKEIIDNPNADTALEKAKNLVSKLDDSKLARQEFADLVRSVLPRQAVNKEDASTDFFKLTGDEVMNRLSKPILPAGRTSAVGVGGATRIGAVVSPPTGGAAGFGQFFTGINSGARNLLNFATYYQMKERAGIVGCEGVNQVLRNIRDQHPSLKIHLIGHSFGGRLMTAAMMGPDAQPPVTSNTMTLLQAAFSHYGFAQHFDGTDDGFFRKVLTNKTVLGPILISCTPNDEAVGIAYPLASLIADQAAATLGDKNSMYGGIGRNGAQKTPEASDGVLLPVGSTYQFQAGTLYNLNADAYIADHGDICKNEVAYAVLTAIATT